jgi:hypothetical protein
MRTSFSSILFSLQLLFLGVLASPEVHASIDESCGCTVKYIVVEMPPGTVSPTTETVFSTGIVSVTQETASIKTRPTSVRSKSSQTTIHASSTAHHNTTATFIPKTPNKVDCSNPENAVPKKTIAMSYGDLEDDETVEQNHNTHKQADKPSNGTFSTFNANKNTTVTKGLKGSIDMDLVMNHPAVVLDYIDAITSVECTPDSIEVKFGKSTAFNNAVNTWLDTFILITSNMGNCKATNGQAFYLVDRVTADKDQKSITCHASEQKLEDIAGMSLIDVYERN